MAATRIRRAPPTRSGISIVSMIDVMIILLFFFMVTSTYLDLDMVPAVEHSNEPAPAEANAAAGPGGTTVLVRITADGSAAIGGQVLTPDALASMIRDRLARDPLTPVIILPSGGADMQALITVMDTLTTAGAVRLRVIRLEATP
jgi:biopolymer transport protein ExbD